MELNNTAAAVLGLLRDGPLTGWDVAAAADEILGAFWHTTRSQVYRELQRLADAGMVVAGDVGPRDRKPYSLTRRGRAAFRSWVDAPPDADTVRIPLLLKLALGDAMSERQRRLMLRNYRRAHERLLGRYRGHLAGFDAETRALAHVVRYGIAHEEAVLRWIDETLRDLDGESGTDVRRP